MTDSMIKPKVLLAEDDKFIWKALSLGLKKNGFTVTIANNGKEVLEKINDELPDILLLDLIMPEMDGFSVLSEFKNRNLLNSFPIIVLSNLGQDEDVKKCHEFGIDNYLIKSNYSIAEIVEKIKSLL